jgi:23S rRNA pseudouridine2604 synthase
VMVDGRIVVPGDRAAPNAEIRLSNEAEAQLDNAITVIMNKPRGFTSAADEFGGAPAMTLLTPENFQSNDCSLAPQLMGAGLRVAGRLSTREMGLVIYTTDTALARRLAAADVEESWLIDFRAPPPGDAIALLTQALQGHVTIEVEPSNANALRLTTVTLGKGILSSICDGQEWRTDITRTRRGEISLGDMPVRGWQLLLPLVQG